MDLEKTEYLTHITLNTGHTLSTPRADVRDDVVEAFDPILEAGGGSIQVAPEYKITISKSENGGAFGFDLTVIKSGAPVIMGVACFDDSEAKETWRGVDLIYRRILKQIPEAQEAPEFIPWIATIIIPLDPLLMRDIHWMADFQRCLGWALYERYLRQ